MEGVSVVCARSAHQSVVRRDLTCLMGGHSGVPVVLLFLRAQINCDFPMFASVTCMLVSVTLMFISGTCSYRSKHQCWHL